MVTDRGDLLIRGFWEGATDTIIDVRVTNLDSKSYKNLPPKKALERQEKEKKKKYCKPYVAISHQAKNATSGSGGTGRKQMSAKRGIKLFGERAVAAIYKKYKQLNDLEVFEGVDFDTLKLELQKKP